MYRCESYIHFGVNLLPRSNMIKKNSLVWKHCVQIQTLTSLRKNSTSYLHVIFFVVPISSLVKKSSFRRCSYFPWQSHTWYFVPFSQFLLAIMTKMGKQRGDCHRNLMVVLKNWKFYMMVTFWTHYALCKKCPETARDKVEYLQNLITLIKNYKCIRFFKK